MTTREQIAVLRAIAEGDLDRHTSLRDDFQAAGRLHDYEAVLATAFRVAVRDRLPGRYRHKDVINLVADARIAMDPTGVAIDPSYVESIVRSVVDDTVNLDGLPESAYPRTYKLVCNYLATARKLGDPDTFMVEVQQVLDAGATPPPAPRAPTWRKTNFSEFKPEDVASLAGMLIGVVTGIGLAAAVLAAAGRRRKRLEP